jgi:hypothetical protein
MFVNPVSEKAYSPIVSISSPNSTVVRLLNPLKTRNGKVLAVFIPPTYGRAVYVDDPIEIMDNPSKGLFCS